MPVPERVNDFFNTNDFDEAMDGIDDIISQLSKDHHPLDNLDCACGEGYRAFAGNNRNPLINSHLKRIYLMMILYEFEMRRKDVIRIDPGDDDPLAPKRDENDEIWKRQAALYDKYLRGAGAWSVPGTSSHSSTMPVVTAPRGGIVYKKVTK